jgi:hypothetical protein
MQTKFISGEQSQAIGRPRTFLNIVLDESSSMEDTATITRQAYNDFIRQQREASAQSNDEVFVTLTKFSYARRVQTVYAHTPLADVPALTGLNYRPDGMTALYDGIWAAIDAMEKKVGEHARVLTLVITDGDENDSEVVTSLGELRKIIESREERGNWTFVFLSAGSNPYATAQGMGFKIGNVQSYRQSDVGNALVRVSKAVADYRKGDTMQTGTFWTGEPDKHERPDWVTTPADADVEDVV